MDKNCVWLGKGLVEHHDVRIGNELHRVHSATGHCRTCGKYHI